MFISVNSGLKHPNLVECFGILRDDKDVDEKVDTDNHNSSPEDSDNEDTETVDESYSERPRNNHMSFNEFVKNLSERLNLKRVLSKRSINMPTLSPTKSETRSEDTSSNNNNSKSNSSSSNDSNNNSHNNNSSNNTPRQVIKIVAEHFAVAVDLFSYLHHPAPDAEKAGYPNL